MKVRTPKTPKKRKKPRTFEGCNPRARRSLLHELLDESESIARDFLCQNINAFIQTLNSNGFLSVFCMFVNIVVDGTFPMDNTAWLLFLDVVRFYSVDNAIHKRSDFVILDVWT